MTNKPVKRRKISLKNNMQGDLNSETETETKGLEYSVPYKSITKTNKLTRAKVLSLIVTLRVAGVQYQDIVNKVRDNFGVEMGISTAHQMYEGYIASIPKDALEHAKSSHLMRIEQIYSMALRDATNALNPPKGRLPRSPAKSLEVCLSALKQMAELGGYDAPIELDLTVAQQEKEAEQAFNDEFLELKANIAEKVSQIENAVKEAPASTLN